MWSATGGLALEVRSKVGFQWTLGAGWYRRQIDLVNPAETGTAIVCSPWWYFCTPVSGVINQNFVGQRSFASFGLNTGIGLTFRLKSGSAIYVEVKYHYIPNDVAAIELIPILVGYRW